MLLLLASSGSFVEFPYWFPIGLIQLMWPYLFIFFLLLFIITVFFNFGRWFKIVCILVLLIAGKEIKNIVAFNAESLLTVQKRSDKLRVAHFNAMAINGYKKGQKDFYIERQRMIDSLRLLSPDVLCIQEYLNLSDTNYFKSNLTIFTDSLQYPYYYIGDRFSGTKWEGYKTEGVGIFSKYPLFDTVKIPFTEKKYPEYIITGKVLFKNKPVQIVTTHLQSMYLYIPPKLPGEDVSMLDKDSSVIFSESKLQKMLYFQQYHISQAKTLNKYLINTSDPVITTVDMNAVSTSWPYDKIRGKYGDAFLNGGNGIGKSFQSEIPFLRIDYIFYDDKNLQMDNFQQYPLSISDHHILIADFDFKH